MKTPDDKRLFTLTAEEVGLIELGLEYYKQNCEGMLNTLPEYLTDHAKEVYSDGIKRMDDLLARIKQWEDGHT